MLTAYDANMAPLLERAGVDTLLVGDSVGMTVLGYDSTIPVTLEMMVHHTAAVTRGTTTALVVADMPFLTYQVNPSEALRNAGRLVQDGGAAAVKIEGGRPMLDVVRRLVDVGIPVMGHLGVLPQSVHQMGGCGNAAKSAEEIENLQADAAALQEAGAFAVVLEMIPADLACDHHAAGHPDHRHRRGTGLRRADSREPRHARPLRSLCPLVRDALRRSRRHHRRRHAGVC